MERMLTVREVADFLGVHENWVYDRAVAGELPSYKIGATRRFLRAELDSWLHRTLAVDARPEPSGARDFLRRRVEWPGAIRLSSD